MAVPNPDATEQLQQIEQAAGEAREQLQEERDSAMRAAQSDAQRAEIDSRFDAMSADLDNKVANAIESVKSDINGRFDSLQALITAQQSNPAGGSTDDAADDPILSIEEITDDAADMASGIADAAGGAVADAADEVDAAPERVHGLFRRWWGG